MPLIIETRSVLDRWTGGVMHDILRRSYMPTSRAT